MPTATAMAMETVMVMVMVETEMVAMAEATAEAMVAETVEEVEMADKRIPRKKGQPANSKKHSDLYTDENPKGTIHGLKFATVDDAKASVAKIKSSGKSHAHKIQAAIAMEQRARVMGKTGPAAVYRKYINAMKKKTKQMQNENTDRLNRVINRHANAMKIHKAQFKKTGDTKHMNAYMDAKKRHDHAVQKQSHGNMQDDASKSFGVRRLPLGKRNPDNPLKKQAKKLLKDIPPSRPLKDIIKGNNAKVLQKTNDQQKNMTTKEALKFTHVAVDKQGKIAGFATRMSDARDTARRHDGKHHQLKKPMHPKVAGMMMNKPLNPVLRKESLEEKKKKKPGLWDNIHKRKKSGKRMRKKGEKGAPTDDAIRQAQASSEMVTTANIPNPIDTAMGPRVKTTTMHDRRRKKDKLPVLLKRFRQYMDDNG